MLRQLDAMLDRQAGVVRAFPGAGKTVALTLWAREAPVPVRWLRLDASDSSPEQLWSDLAAAVEVDQQIVERYSASVEATASVFMDVLAGAPEPVWLVLDDVDTVAGTSLHAGLDILLEHAENLHLVLSVRRHPDLRGIAHLRLVDEIVEIGNEQLRMDETETFELLSSVGVPSLDSSTVASLVKQTEGWAAGIAMIASELRLASFDDRRRATEVDREFPSVHRYFVHQLRDAVSEEQYDFLRDTSVLDALEPEMCDTVRARDDSAQLCFALERAGMFVTRFDGTAEQYAMHSLLRRAMRRELNDTRPGRREALHRAAAEWSQARGRLDAAFGHWLDAGDVDRAWSAFREQHTAYLSAVTRAQLLDSADVLERAAGSTGANSLELAFALLLVGEVERAAPWLARAETELEGRAGARGAYDPHDQRARAMVGFAKFLLLVASGDLAGALGVASAARDSLERAMPGEWRQLRGPLWQALAHAAVGDTRAARRLVTSLAADIGDWTPSDRVTVPGANACIALEEGALTKALGFANEALSAATRLSAHTAVLEVHAHWARGAVSLEQNRLDDATEDLERAFALGRRSRFVGAFVLPGLDLAYLRFVRGDASAARALLTELDELTRRWNPSPLNERTIEQWARLALLEDDLAGAARLAARLTEPRRFLLLAQLHAATGDEAAARDALRHAELRSASLRDRLVEVLVNAQLASVDAARTELVHAALTLAEPEGYVRLFADRAHWIIEPLERLVSDWPTSYVSDLLGAIANTPGRGTPTPKAWPLTEREHDVWRHLGTRLSTREIGARLGISHNTVKTHMRSIYRKLGVRNRREAVARGRGGAGAVSG